MERRVIQDLACPLCNTKHTPTPETLQDGVFSDTCRNCGNFIKFKVANPVRSSVTFTINGMSYTIGNEYAAALSLNEFLRSEGVSYGTKAMCIEGGCGVCLVTATLFDPVTDSTQTYAVNSCLLPLYACDGMQVTTIEGLGNPRDGLHPIQDRLAQYNGSQCGFCSPAQVMNMYGLLKRITSPTMQQVEDDLDGSICRCTGYRSILDAMKSFASDAPADALPGGTIDIEDVDKKLCSKTGQPCTGKCSTRRQEPVDLPVHIVTQGAQWQKPTSKQELYTILKQYQGGNYRLVFGNSGFGVYREIGPWMYSLLIDIRGIKELYNISVDPNSKATIGANVSLTSLMETFEKNSSQSTFHYFTDFAEHFSVIGNTGLRNLASWAGNLMLKNLHPEFPSDIFTMFETVGATLLIGSSDGSEYHLNLSDFIIHNMKGKVILSVDLPTFSSGDVFIKTYKIRPRNQNAHAYVNAGFRMQLDEDSNFVVQSKPSIVYGGINKTMVHATQTEVYLIGKELGDPTVLQGAISTLTSELQPDSTAGLSSPSYRKNLAVSLFYKCVLGLCGEKAGDTYKSGGTSLIRPVSSGTQSFDTDKSEYPFTEAMPKTLATVQTSGKAEFVNDVPPRPREVYASFVISSEGNAEIDTVDTSAALAYPGVLKYLSKDDIPAGGANSFSPSVPPEEIFSSGEILYAGQPIGLIVAVDKLTADTAASMVKITYKNVKTPILTIEDAINKGSVFPNVAKPVKIGDAAAAINQSDNTLSGQVSLGYQYHFYMETQVSISYPSEDEEGLTILSSTQWADMTQQAVARLLNIKESSINVEVRRLGGAFGGKITRSLLVACASALAAHVLRRPVRLQMNFHTNMKALGGRNPNMAKYQVGFTKDGKLNGIKLNVNQDCGSNPAESGLAYMPIWMGNAYYCPAWDFEPVAIKTNKPCNTACRAPASNEIIFIQETIMDHVAAALGKDPLEVRKLNLYTKGQKAPNGMVLEYCNITDMVAQLEQSADVSNRKQQIATFNAANRWRKKGISVNPIRWELNLYGVHFNAFMTVYHGDGSVSLSIGGVENGQGIQTKMMQLVAYELGIPMDTIRVKPMETLSNANSSTTGGSTTTDVNAYGVLQCCNQLKASMAPVKAKMTNPTWIQLVTECYKEGVDLSTRYYTNPTGVNFDYNIYGVTCTEVEVDVLTGENQITRVDILYDCGESMNPEIDVGQAEGGFVMGLGYWLTEEMRYDPTTGRALTDGTWEYKPPLGKDIPIDFRIQMMKNHPNKRGVLGSKALGEPPLVMSSSVISAIKHAIQEARKGASKPDLYTLDAPATVEAIQTACLVDPTQLVYGS